VTEEDIMNQIVTLHRFIVTYIETFLGSSPEKEEISHWFTDLADDIKTLNNLLTEIDDNNRNVTIVSVIRQEVAVPINENEIVTLLRHNDKDHS
jgi:hypothetical protein